MLSVIEILCSVGLVVAVFQPFGILAPIAAAFIAAEMLLFCVLHVASRSREYGPVLYWLVVAALAGFIAYGRFVLLPL